MFFGISFCPKWYSERRLQQVSFYTREKQSVHEKCNDLQTGGLALYETCMLPIDFRG